MTCLFNMSQFPCLLHGIAEREMVVCLPHRVVVGIPVLVCVKEMCAALPGTASESVAGQGQSYNCCPGF